MTAAAAERACAHCGGPMQGKRPHALYCTRQCKTKASDARRVADGRAQERDRARYDRESEHRRAYAARYLSENAEKMRAVRRRRKGQIRSEALVFTDRDWHRLVARHRGCCAYCGRRSDDLQREHVVPLCRGGRHSIGNILPACPRCNYSKHRRLLSDWRYRVLSTRGGEPNPTPL